MNFATRNPVDALFVLILADHTIKSTDIDWAALAAEYRRVEEKRKGGEEAG